MTLEEALIVIKEQQETISALTKIINAEKFEKEQIIQVNTNQSIGKEPWYILKTKLERRFAKKIVSEEVIEDAGEIKKTV